MKFSITVSVLNEEKYIHLPIESILRQGCDFELFIMDGGSTDKTKEIVESYKDDRIKFISYVGEGPVERRIHEKAQRGLEMSTGDVFGALSADEWYADGIFKRVEKDFEDPKVNYIVGRGEWLNEDMSHKEFMEGGHPESQSTGSIFARLSAMRLNGIKWRYETLPALCDVALRWELWWNFPPLKYTEVIGFHIWRNKSISHTNEEIRMAELNIFNAEIVNKFLIPK